MMKLLLKTILIVSLIVSCKAKVQDMYLGQGIMAGEATSSSVILETRN